ncbi:MAG: type II toxin-antitoxin system PemK/MazF family toxin [Candidatus Pacebacteria bacterium]|nr:type II toxin-antitoxin system PemK/MazF family toxin [Candidatus Paceibacterota bacterium]
MEYKKDFDLWNTIKKRLNEIEAATFVHSREIWWCALGVNIGAEIDGKNVNFERPVLALRAYNKQTILVLPIVSKISSDNFHYITKTTQKPYCICLTQSRTVSSQRMLRKIDIVGVIEFENIKEIWKKGI